MSDPPVKAPPTLEELRARRDEIVALADNYRVFNVRVFGSVARGEAGLGSDVDFLVSAPRGVTIFDLVGLWLDLQELLGCEVSLVPDGVNDEQFLSRIQVDAVPL
jgi:predicted nucleotidyltransferase